MKVQNDIIYRERELYCDHKPRVKSEYLHVVHLVKLYMNSHVCPESDDVFSSLRLSYHLGIQMCPVLFYGQQLQIRDPQEVTC